MFDKKERFVIRDYEKKSPFSSFLPGISGKMGIPMWCYYVNRGQGIACFGVEDKNHSIMEFFPAQQSYAHTSRMGFRTFVKKDGTCTELFTDTDTQMNLYIGMNELEVENIDEKRGLKANVLYYTLPEEPVAGLVRKLTIENIGEASVKLEILDGMPALIPNGVSLASMKEMAQTSMAWMQVEDLEEGLPFFAVRASMEDTAEVKEISGGYYYFTVDEMGQRLPAIVDPVNIFDYDTSYERPVVLEQQSLETMFSSHQVTQNKLPCCFTGKLIELAPKEKCILYTLVGEAATKEKKRALAQKAREVKFFEEKYNRAIEITRELCQVIETKTGNKIFDEYCKQTFLDNVLRGGYPILLGGKIFYLYSRKHGDIERDYNFFRMLPEYYSQGNGNFRDVNQNRRSDVLFAPYVKDENIKTFYSLIQIDGYNPLVVEKITYTVKAEKVDKLLELINSGNKEALKTLLTAGFTPGQLLKQTESDTYTGGFTQEDFLELVVSEADYEVNSQFGEGYWTDHWTYNLDLIESFLSVYPEQEENLLFDDNSYDYFESRATVLPRGKRYVKTEKGIRQYHSTQKREPESTRLRSEFGKGEKIQSSLIEKLILLCLTKYSALDPFGLGVEMEGGKPGWYDALNGLPGLLGSSVAETCELFRMLAYTVKITGTYKREVTLLSEVEEFLQDVYEITTKETDQFILWDKINDRKETYREEVCQGVSGRKAIMSSDKLESIFEAFMKRVEEGLKRAVEYGNGICPTYFHYEVTRYEETPKGIKALEFREKVLPYFLEGPVRYFKLDCSMEEKMAAYEKVKSSQLYDKSLCMYKVNASIQEASFELGRAKAFTPGWLENESIWLHMEYKYLLELLKNGMYDQFKEDFKNAAVPFLNAETYGRSILENSSFIASSANPDKRIHGKGFVARLSGSTAEFLQMWQVLMFGKNPFTMEEEITLELKPYIPSYLIGEEKQVEATFLGRIKVIYELDGRNELSPQRTPVRQYVLTMEDGRIETVSGHKITGAQAVKVREGKVSEIRVSF